MLSIKPYEDFKVGDLVMFINQLDNNLYGVVIKIDLKNRYDYPYCVRTTNGFNIWMSEWDLEKVA